MKNHKDKKMKMRISASYRSDQVYKGQANGETLDEIINDALQKASDSDCWDTSDHYSDTTIDSIEEEYRRNPLGRANAWPVPREAMDRGDEDPAHIQIPASMNEGEIEVISGNVIISKETPYGSFTQIKGERGFDNTRAIITLSKDGPPKVDVRTGCVFIEYKGYDGMPRTPILMAGRLEKPPCKGGLVQIEREDNAKQHVKVRQGEPGIQVIEEQ